MAKMQGAEAEGAGSVLKVHDKARMPIATKQIGYYDTPSGRGRGAA